MRSIIIAICGLCLLLGSQSRADLSFKSYFNYQDEYLSATERLRYKMNKTLFGSVSTNLEYELTAYLGGNLSNPAFRNQALMTKPYYLGMDNVVLNESGYILKQRVDRLNLKWGGWTMGREAVAFGVGRIWEPNDYFAPFLPTEIDKDNKTGVDVIKYDRSLSELSDITLVYSPSNPTKSSYAGRLRFTTAGIENSLIAGQIADRSELGICFDGSLGGAGVRGSVNFSSTAESQGICSYILGADYMFAGGLYLLGEYYYNGAGSRYLAMGYSYDFWSLYTARGYVFNNFDDGSRLYWQEIDYSISDSGNIKSGIMLSSGRQGSEYAALSALFYSLLAFYF